MRKLLLAACVPMVFFTSCDKETPALTKAQIARAADSIATARIKELDMRAERDLEYRMKIELKGKSDSIVNAKLAGNSKDTMAIANSNVQIPNSNGNANGNSNAQNPNSAGNSKVQIPNSKDQPGSKVSQ